MCMCVFFFRAKKMSLGFYAIYSKSQIRAEYLVSSTTETWNVPRHLWSHPTQEALSRDTSALAEVPLWSTVTTHLLSGSYYLEYPMGTHCSLWSRSREQNYFFRRGRCLQGCKYLTLCLPKIFSILKSRIHEEEEQEKEERRRHS